MKTEYLREIAKLVALDLPGYEVAPLPADAEPWQNDHAYLVAGGGEYIRGASKGLYIHLSHYRDGRLAISCLWPSVNGCNFAPRDDKSITVDPNRLPKAIAKDIQRRLLAEYDAAWAEATQRRDNALAEEVAHKALTDNLAALMGPDVRRSEHSHTLHAGDVKVDVHHSDRVSLEISYGNPSLAEKVLRALEAASYFMPVCSNTECLKPATKFTEHYHGGCKQWWCDSCYLVEMAQQTSRGMP